MMIELSLAAWRKSTRSGGGDCVEVAGTLAGVVAVRDGKDATGPVLVFGTYAWSAFVTGLRAGYLTR